MFLLEMIGYTVLYFAVRETNKKHHIFILCSLLLGGIAQAAYGNLQLYGIYSSNHGLFKMTGSFFNPGPYAGYLATILPVAIALLLLKYAPPSFVQDKNITGEKLPAPNRSHSKYEPDSHSGSFFNLYFKIVNELKYLLGSKGLYILMLTAVVTTLLVLPALKSRAAWLATIASLIYVLMQIKSGNLVNNTFPGLEKWKPKIEIWKKHLLLKVISIIVLLAILFGGAFALYQMKKGSANGRLLIWKVSSTMIIDKPIFGFGTNGFEKNYMEYQAKYFTNNPTSEEIYVADNSKYAFNEFVRTSTEMGIIGLAILFTLLYFAFFGKNSKLTKSEKTLLISIRAAILSAIVFGMFSYPDSIIPTKVTFILFLALSANYAKESQFSLLTNLRHTTTQQYSESKILKFVIRSICATTLLLITSFVVTKGIKLKSANKIWKQAYITYQMGAYEASVSDYQKVFPILKDNGDFLLNYGKGLSMAEKHKEAIEILEYAKKEYPNTILYTALGDSFKALDKNYEAEQAYLHAWQMIPSRFYPKYLLAKLYNESGETEKAIQVANELLSKEIKIHSTAIEEIKQEMRKIVADLKEL
jgi:O-antigen ligase